MISAPMMPSIRSNTMVAKLHFLYKTVAPGTGKYYIGVHTSIRPYSDNYQGSGDWVKDCGEKGIHLITGILDFFPSAREAYMKEATLVTWERIWNDPLMMNRICGGMGGWKGMTPEKCAERNQRSHSENERMKRSETLTNYYKAVSHHTTGIPKSAEQKLEMSKSQRGRTFSAESRAKMSATHKARIALLGIKPVPPCMKGVKRNLKEVECPRCGFRGKGGNMTRYHFDNCKN
jgi:hypothetical protein